MIDVLVADDEQPALDELVHLLRTDDRIGEILTARTGADALRQLSERAVRIAFLDIHMPGLLGTELARAFLALADPPAVVFVTADEARAVEAFELRAADYLLKPVRTERLRRAVDRVLELGESAASGDDEVIPVTVGSAVRFVHRKSVVWAQAQGDYSRLHTDDGTGHLVRIPISELESRWADAGFLRIHRSVLVRISAVTEARLSGSDPSLVIDGVSLSVSRRLVPTVREALVRGEAGP
ncbi:LytR/AlgR family response regulator transcription factor [Microbacterium phyllosphaerae]|uniref:LytR/AlgR family response regulator transcription factor n=1 Tax=Microbacterium phyllosphaerae TaxID=124798 RepID=UPI002168F45C|nr:LytTR family DNA-binding domain-containing protein [Microbacterium phyllosphaerae]MCS3442604.1 DNA-binding LytR/AlgR family response regulator [Microbacterium phyllosphaerae]